MTAPSAKEAFMGKLARAAELLRAADRIVILSHSSPDGDTLGSAEALCRALLPDILKNNLP